MSTIFSQIIAGEIPGRFVWKDDDVVVFLDAFPQNYGHALVVTRHEYDEWTELPAELAAHIFKVATLVGKAQKVAFKNERIGLIIQGYAIPHVHVHVFPTNEPEDFDPARAMTETDPVKMDRALEALQAQLKADTKVKDLLHVTKEEIAGL